LGIEVERIGTTLPARFSKEAMTRPTLATQVYLDLKRRILGSELALGQRLNIDELAKLLDVSPSPVKEALKQLEADGLIEIRARRQTLVRQFTSQEVREIYQLRDMLEPAAAVAAIRCGAVDDALLTRLTATLEELEAASRGTAFADPAAVLAADGGFHRLVVAAAGNKRLETIHSQLSDQAHLIRMFSTRSPRARDTLDEHRRIFRALERRDEEEAALASSEHLKSACEDILRAVHAIESGLKEEGRQTA
jgi:DNA-binding GntR family transcriptional regulator